MIFQYEKEKKMIITVDARGCACPEPVIKTKKAMSGDHDELIVLVDNKTAVENIKRFSSKHGYSASFEETEGSYRIVLKKL